MNYFIYTYIISLLTGRYELNKLTSLPMCGFRTQLVEHRTGIAEVTGSNPVEALIFFRLLLSSCLNWKIHCEDHSSLSKLQLHVLSVRSLLLIEFGFSFFLIFAFYTIFYTKLHINVTPFIQNKMTKRT